jgi:hypothetical protein
MFPNVRLLVGALFASVVALTCGFGLFAAFRVNHEPLSRLPVGTAPIQFVANERTGWGTPFDGQSRLNGPQHGAIVATPAAAPAHQMKAEAASTGTAEAIRPVVAAIPVIDTAPPRAIGQPAEVIEPIVSITPAAPAPADTASPLATANSSAGAAQPTGTIAATPSAQPSEREPQAGSAAPVVAEPSSAKPAEDEAAAKPDSDAGAAVKAAAPAIAAATPADQPSAAAPPASEPAQDTVMASAKPEAPVGKIEAKITRKPIVRRRIAVRRRIVRRLRPSPAQNTGFGDPVFRSAPNYSSASASRSPASPSNW